MNKRQMLIEYIIQEIVAFIVEDNKLNLKEAMDLLYNSDTFEKLQDFETGFYLEALAYVYDILKEELLAEAV